MFNGIGFSSVFKIEEKPILRPCLSESKREEIQRFKAKALEIERRLAEKNRNSTNDSTKHVTIEDDRTDENIQDLVEDIESCSGQSENQTDLDNENFVTSISEWDVSSIPGFDYDNGTASICSAATETVDCSENVNDNAGQADQTTENTVVPTFIRSNSFIVDEPSECFLKQLECSGVMVSSSSMGDVGASTGTLFNQLNPTKVFAKPVEKRKPDMKKSATPKAKKYPPKPYTFKKARIPSDNISNLPEKMIRKCQNNSMGAVDIRRERLQKSALKEVPVANIPTRKIPISSIKSLPQTDTSNYECHTNDTNSVDARIAQIVANIEEKFHNEIASFLDKQKREQEAFFSKLMQEVQVKQDTFQCNLFMQIKSLIGDGVSTLLKNHDNITVVHTVANHDDNKVATLNSMTGLINDVNGNVHSLEINDNECRQSKESRAATKINAFVRGYLTRRLFKTELVQDVIKTIRDSLYLVIDLHFEDTDVESIADIQMKHNLLQQLESSRYNLSHIFVEKTQAEQMAIIACDRQIMMNRLLRPNSANKSKQPTSHPRPTSVEDKLKKLKSIKL